MPCFQPSLSQLPSYILVCVCAYFQICSKHLPNSDRNNTESQFQKRLSCPIRRPPKSSACETVKMQIAFCIAVTSRAFFTCSFQFFSQSTYIFDKNIFSFNSRATELNKTLKVNFFRQILCFSDTRNKSCKAHVLIQRYS